MSNIGTVNLGIPAIKPFSGNNKEYDPKEFILKMHLQLELRALPEDVKALFVATFLEGKALRWYERLDLITKRDIKLFEKAFLERFPSHIRQDTILDCARKYHSIHQITTVQNYNQQFRDITYQLPDNVYLQQGHLIKYILGLKKMIGYEVSQRNCSTVDEAMDVAARFEAARDLREKVYFRKPKRNEYAEMRVFEKDFSQNDQMEVDNVLTRRHYPNKLECYNCGKEGHFAARCPNRPKN